MRTGLWIAVTAAVWLIGFAGGYAVSKATAIQPGYFEAADAGGYGGSGGGLEGVDKSVQDYYKDLYKDE